MVVLWTIYTVSAGGQSGIDRLNHLLIYYRTGGDHLYGVPNLLLDGLHYTFYRCDIMHYGVIQSSSNYISLVTIAFFNCDR